MIKKIVECSICILFGSAISALGLYCFVYPADFAPTGFDGVATMLQQITGLNAGIYVFALNVPLLVMSFIFLDKKFTVYTVLSTISLSAMLLILDKVDFPQYVASGDKILSAIFSGVMIGVRTGLMMKVGGSSGGVDILAGIIQKKHPYVNLEKYITVICFIIIGISFFVYQNLECIFLSVIMMFVFEKTVGFLMRSLRNAVEFKIVTEDPSALKEEIILKLKHGATVVDGKGLFTGNDKSIIFCVVNVRQVPEFMKILKKYDKIFVYCSDVSSVNGNFRWRNEDAAK